LDEQLNLSS